MFIYCNDINEKKPDFDQTVLIKVKNYEENFDPPIYVCTYIEGHGGNENYFVEASGEQYAKWYENEVECWIDAKCIHDDMYVLEEWK